MTVSGIEKVQEILNNEGWKYMRKDNNILLVATFCSRKWKVVISCEGEGQVCCFAVYPWAVPVERRTRILEGLNELNLTQRKGCFMLNTQDMRVIYRCGVQVLDEYTSWDYIKNVLLCSVASVNANWENIYGMIFSAS